MIPTMLSSHPSTLTAFALNVFLSGTVVSLITLMTARLAFRHNPSVRYFLSLIALIAILLSPVVVGIQERLGFSLVTFSLPASLAPGISADSRVSERVQGMASVSNGVALAIGGVLAVWVAGVLWGIVRLLRGCRAVSRLRADIRPWDDAAYTEVRATTERILGRALPPIYTSPRISSPVAVGVIRPIVILPAGFADTLPPTQLQQILLHECAHVTHRHLLGGLAERIARLLFWLHPLVVLLCQELGRAREEVCDNVASQGSGATCYARTLLALAQGTLPAPNLASMLALLGPETSLEQRISGLLHPRRNRMVGMKQGKLWAVTGVAVLALVSMVAVRVVAAPGKKSSPTPPPATVLVARSGDLSSELHEIVIESPDSQTPAGEGQPQKSPVYLDASITEIQTGAVNRVDVIPAPNGAGQEQLRSVVMIELKKEDHHRSAVHAFFAHVHQMFGALFSFFHEKPAETLNYSVDLHKTALDTVHVDTVRLDPK